VGIKSTLVTMVFNLVEDELIAELLSILGGFIFVIIGLVFCAYAKV
jgi:hypothetical protein